MCSLIKPPDLYLFLQRTSGEQVKEQVVECAIRGMTPYEKRLFNDVTGLLWVYKFGWLRTTELGPLLWPANETARHQADRLVRSWLERDLVLARELPDGAGRAFVLARKGVRLLSENGHQVSTGKDIGETHDGVWRPPMSWRHDLLAAGVLVDLHRRGWKVYPEAHIRRSADEPAKWPDGIATRGNQVVWLEVESARKTGPALRSLANALCAASAGGMEPIFGLRPTAALVAYREGSMDERGYGLDHRSRVRKAISAAARRPVPIFWASCNLRGLAGVGTVAYDSETIQADHAIKVRRVLDAVGWREDDGCLTSNYGSRLALVWEDSDGPGLWGWEAGGQVSRTASLESAKQACAAAIAQEVQR